MFKLDVEKIRNKKYPTWDKIRCRFCGREFSLSPSLLSKQRKKVYDHILLEHMDELYEKVKP